MQNLCIEFVRFVRTGLISSKNLTIKKTCVCDNNFEKTNCSKRICFRYCGSMPTELHQHDNEGGGIRTFVFQIRILIHKIIVA